MFLEEAGVFLVFAQVVADAWMHPAPEAREKHPLS